MGTLDVWTVTSPIGSNSVYGPSTCIASIASKDQQGTQIQNRATQVLQITDGFEAAVHKQPASYTYCHFNAACTYAAKIIYTHDLSAKIPHKRMCLIEYFVLLLEVADRIVIEDLSSLIGIPYLPPTFIPFSPPTEILPSEP